MLVNFAPVLPSVCHSDVSGVFSVLCRLPSAHLGLCQRRAQLSRARPERPLQAEVRREGEAGTQNCLVQG